MKTVNRRSCLKLAACAAFAGSTTGLFSGRALAAPASEGKGKAIVIYYSRTGSTEALAKMIAEHTGAALLKIDVKEKYAPDYGDMTYIARDEVRANARRELETVIPDLSGYDTVFLGTPY